MKKPLIILMALALMGCEAVNPVLDIEGGKVQGVKTELKDVYVYRGIPYAAPPIGELRWKAPQPVVPWEGVLVADKFGHPGYQSVHYPGGYTTEWGYGDEAPYSEDCLYLNVWTPAPGKTDAKLPVALWIHGGGFREGWGSEPEFDAKEWAARGVVLVSINYRLGIFGFLTHPELAAENPDGVSGNYGLLDQIESLKWIRKNIEQFGGDPDNVMIFGQSAGGGSVRFLCESPLTEGLFNKAIIMSAGGLGRAPRVPMTLDEAQQKSKEVLDWGGLTDLKKMRSASTETLYALGNVYFGATGQWPRLTMQPIVDGKVLLREFDEAALSNTLHQVPYMIGFTQDDMGDMGDGIAAFCINREELGQKAYAYQFARPLPTDGRANVLKGAFHSSDLWFVFKSLEHCWRPWTQGDWDLSDKMIGAWTNFAKYGDPNGPDGGVWKPYTKENPEFMIFKLDENDAEASAPGIPLPKNK
ncbi:MAG: carboxylesterase family protein [Bacteroidales bacterium]|nr:carboxylesterase family protein [Bacteroidales bacterium]